MTSLTPQLTPRFSASSPVSWVTSALPYPQYAHSSVSGVAPLMIHHLVPRALVEVGANQRHPAASAPRGWPRIAIANPTTHTFHHPTTTIAMERKNPLVSMSSANSAFGQTQRLRIVSHYRICSPFANAYTGLHGTNDMWVIGTPGDHDGPLRTNNLRQLSESLGRKSIAMIHRQRTGCYKSVNLLSLHQ